MKNLNDLLKQVFNATDEQISAFTEAMKSNSIYTASEENLDIRYGKLKQENEAAVQERDAAKNTIAELQKAAEGNAELQATIKKLTDEMNQTKLDSAIKVGLMAEKVVDVGYLTYKLHEKLRAENETLTLDDNGNIKDWSNKVAALKVQFPNMFEAGDEKSNANGFEVVDPLALRKGKSSDVPTREDFKNMSYEKRVELKQQNEALYRQLRNNE